VVSLSQRLPGGGQRKIEERAAVHSAEAQAAAAEALRLSLLTEARTLYHEIGYLDRHWAVLSSETRLLSHFEELARARYVSGKGLQQEVVTIQAELTRIDVKLSDIAARRASAVADLNALRNRPNSPIPAPLPSEPMASDGIDWSVMRDRALSSRPELASLAAQGRRAETAGEIADSRAKPDFVVGVTYAWVDRRTDVDVPDNGQDIFGLTGGITIPLWGKSVDAGREEATQRRLIVDEERRAVVSTIDRQLEGLRGRMPEIRRQLGLFEGILEIQSDQALRSAEAAYAAGQVDALALLDAQRTLLDVRLAAARSRADLAIAIAQLEATIAGPITIGSESSFVDESSNADLQISLERVEERRSKNEDPAVNQGGVS
jgi:outer membrane protein TolC